MPGILYLHGGADFARRVFRQERRGYWSAALPTVLEKHGVLGVEVAGPEMLRDGQRLGDFDAVLVGRMPDEAWSPEAVETVTGLGRPVLIEGPVAAPLRAFLGIREVHPEEPAAALRLIDRALRHSRIYGAAPAGRLVSTWTREVPREVALDWRSLPNVPITAEQAAAWQGRGWDLERWIVDGQAEVLAEWSPARDPKDAFPAVLRRGELTACSFGLFAMLGQGHTSEPWGSGEFRTSSRTFGFEVLLLNLLDEMHRRVGAVRGRVLPWPRGAQWAMNVRHDFDRPLPASKVKELIAGHDRVGTAATWYWRSRHLRHGGARLWRRRHVGNHAIRVVDAARRHEVALHTEGLYAGGERERRVIEKVIGHEIRGTSAHGDASCFRFQGAPNLLWAEQQRLLYTELIQHAHYHPHRFAALGADGTVEPLQIICLPHHASLDLGMEPEQTAEERILGTPAAFAPVGGFLQVMNHPDIHVDTLFATLDRLPRSGRVDWTAAQAADWWSRTHVRGALELAPLGDGRFRLRSAKGVEAVAVELLAPDGERRVRLANLEPGVPAEVSLGLVHAG